MFDGLLPHDVITEYGDPTQPASDLLPEEAALVASAGDKRRNEFARGRACARAALSRFGIHGFALLAGPEREPIWPPGVVGSVTHTQGLCAVAVAACDRYAGLGIDVEPALPLTPALVERICRNDETAQLSRLQGIAPLTAARLVFSAKEAVYKCQFRLTRKFLAFREVGIELDPRGTFAVSWRCDSQAWPCEYRFRGSWRWRGEFLLTAAWLEPTSATAV
jgi:4'-phosphopantetheinyl transferase EntD